MLRSAARGVLGVYFHMMDTTIDAVDDQMHAFAQLVTAQSFRQDTPGHGLGQLRTMHHIARAG